MYLNKGWPARWHLLYYLLLNMFQTLIRPSSGACDYMLRCVCWLEACWCYVARLSVGDVVSECRLNHYTRIPHHQQTIPLHNTSTPQVSLHNNALNSRKLLKMDILTSETCWAVDNKANVIQLVNLYSNIKMMHGPKRIRVCSWSSWRLGITWVPELLLLVSQ